MGALNAKGCCAVTSEDDFNNVIETEYLAKREERRQETVDAECSDSASSTNGTITEHDETELNEQSDDTTNHSDDTMNASGARTSVSSAMECDDDRIGIDNAQPLNIQNIDDDEEEKKEDKSKETPIRIQVEQLPEFEQSYKWILDKNRKIESPASETPTIKAFKYNKQIMAQKRVTLTNEHNFLWFSSIIQGSLQTAEQESEISRNRLDKVLNLLPVPYRDKVWEICNVDNDAFIVSEEYKEFVDALLVAIGQYDIDEIDENELMFEFRDMSAIFYEVINIEQLFKGKQNISDTVSKTTATLTTFGATKLILILRNLKSEDDIAANDISIPLLTGFTKDAIRHSVTYCTRIFWKILTNIWWDEDDDDDTALPQILDAYNTRKHYRKRSKVSDDVRRHLSKTSMDDLFPNLYNNKIFENDPDSDDEETDDEENQQNGFLKI